MPFDAFFLTAVRRELEGSLTGCRIDKVQQPQRDTLILSMRGAAGGGRLLLTASPNHPRIHLTNEPAENPAQPPMFCMLLRKHLTGGRLVSMQQPEMERLLDLTFDCTDEMGSPTRKHLILEIMGRNSNLILTGEDGRILDCLRRVDFEMSEKRQVLPGLYYHLPPTQGKRDPFAVTQEELTALLAAQRSPRRLDGWLLDTFGGFSPLVCRELAFCLTGDLDTDVSELPEAEKTALAARLHARIEQLRTQPPQPVLLEKMDALGMLPLYTDIELPLCPVLARMEHTGFLVDRKALYDFGESLTSAIEQLQQSIWACAGEPFNIQSPKQLGHVLFDQLMLPAGKKTKTGWSTNAAVLEKLRGKHPIIDQILDYRMLTKLKSTYADGLLKEISADGRIHTNFQMTVTATGRLSSTEPNLQNIPVRRELGAQIRNMFVASPGKVLVDADYSQIELRLLAHIADDETMIAAFRSGEDIHAVTASQVFGVPLDEVTPLQRSHAKAVNFGIVYGISAFSLAQDIGVFQSEAKAYMDSYFAKYHGVRDYMKRIVEQAKADGYVTTLFGRRRDLPELRSSNFNLRSFGERVALNMPIQGTAADVMKLAMVRVHDRLRREAPEAKLLLQVHDELIVECPEELAEQAARLLTEEMEGVMQLSVPLVAEAHWGKNWLEAK